MVITALLLCCVSEFEQTAIYRDMQLTALFLEDLEWGATIISLR